MEDEKIVEAVEEANRPDSNLIHLSTGVVLEGRKAKSVVLLRVMSAFPRPKPPVVFIKAMGRNMENADDPDYIERIKAWKQESGMALVNAMILLGTAPHSVPKGFSKPDDNDWMEEYALLGLPLMPENKTWRYLTWVTYKACADELDYQQIQRVVGKLSGVREADVKSAATFPGSDDAGR